MDFCRRTFNNCRMKETFLKSLLTVLLPLLSSVSASELALAEAPKDANSGLCIIRISNEKDADLRVCAALGQTPEGQACHQKAADKYDAALAECEKLPKQSF